MSTPDTPDSVRGVVNAQRLLGSFGFADTTETINIPANVVALWIFVGLSPDPPPPTVTGVATGLVYPLYSFPNDDANDAKPAMIALVSAAIDAQVTIAWAGAPGAPWYVVGDTGPHIAIDPALAGSVGTPTNPVPGSAVQVAGSDGTDLRTLLTDATGALVVSGGGGSVPSGPPGSPPPADAVFIGGTDGTDLQALLTDAGGRLIIIDSSISGAIQPAPNPAPPDTLQVGGSDGTDIYTLLTDNAGHQLTIDQLLKLCIAVANTAKPSDAVMVAGQDGTDIRPLFTDSAGRAIVLVDNFPSTFAAPGATVPIDAVMVGGSDGTHLQPIKTNKVGNPYTVSVAPDSATADHPPNELKVAAAAAGAALSLLVAAPGAGLRLRIFHATVAASTAGTLAALEDSSATVNIVAAGTFPQQVSGLPSGIPLPTNTGVEISTTGGATASASVVYTIETV